MGGWTYTDIDIMHTGYKASKHNRLIFRSGIGYKAKFQTNSNSPPPMGWPKFQLNAEEGLRNDNAKNIIYYQLVFHFFLSGLLYVSLFIQYHSWGNLTETIMWNRIQSLINVPIP